MTNNPMKIADLKKAGITVHKRIPLEVDANLENADYLLTKARRMQHMLDLDLIPARIALRKNGGPNGPS